MHNEEFLIPIAFFFVVGFIVKVSSDNSTRRKAIDKGIIDENLKYLYADKFMNQVPSALKWGIVFTFVGLAIFIIKLVPDYVSDEITIATMFLSAGIGLIVYYFIASYMIKNRQEQEKFNPAKVD